MLSNADDDGHVDADGDSEPAKPWSAFEVQDAAAAAMAAAACMAKSMADAEERDIQRTVAEVKASDFVRYDASCASMDIQERGSYQLATAQIIELQLHKVKIKLSQHEVMENGLKKEQAAWERERRAVLAARGM